MPEHEARAFFLQMEQVERLADLAVVALVGFLELREVGLEILVAEPRGAIDALEHLVVRIAAPVGARDLHELECAQLRRIRHVRAAAQIDPVALPVQRDLLARRDDVVDDLRLVDLALVLEESDRVVLRHDAALDRQRLGDDLVHLGLDLREVVGRERRLAREVVVETVVDDGTDRDLRVGEQPLRRLREQVRSRMTQDVERLGALLGDDRQLRVVFDAETRVDELAVDLAGERGLREAGADRRGDVLHRDSVIELALAAVGERDVDHGRFQKSQ